MLVSFCRSQLPISANVPTTRFAQLENVLQSPPRPVSARFNIFLECVAVILPQATTSIRRRSPLYALVMSM